MKSKPPIIRNIGWNLGGNILSLLIGLIAFRPLVSGLGVERFGILGLIWLVVGYFSIFDIGLSRSVTKIVAELLGDGRWAEAKRAASTALLLMAGVGVAVAVAAFFLSPVLVRSVLTIPEALRDEAVTAFRLVSVSIPVVIYTTGLRGILEAHQAFKSTSLLRTLSGLGTYLGPLIAIPFGSSLVIVVAVLLGVRLAIWWGHERALVAFMHVNHRGSGFDRIWARPLLTHGGWMSVTNVVGPLMVSLDRFLIGSVLSVVAVSYYVAPYEIVTRLLIVPSAIAGVLFPYFSASRNAKDGNADDYYRRGVLFSSLLMFPGFLVLAYLAPEILTFWLGPSFAVEGSAVMAWLAAGALMTCVAQIPFAFVQSTGRPKWTALLHLSELLPYFGILFVAMKSYGIEGVAAAWFLRSAIDAFMLIWLSYRLGSTDVRPGGIVVLSLAAIVILLLPGFLTEFWVRGVLFILFFILFLCVFWCHVMNGNDRRLARSIVAFRGKNGGV